MCVLYAFAQLQRQQQWQCHLHATATATTTTTTAVQHCKVSSSIAKIATIQFGNQLQLTRPPAIQKIKPRYMYIFLNILLIKYLHN